MATNWDDLKPRVLSSIGMVAIGAAAIWAGGIWFFVLIGVSAAFMMWELVRMVDPAQTQGAILVAIMMGAAVVVSPHFPNLYPLIILLLPVTAGLGVVKRHRMIFGLYALLIAFASYGFIIIRHEYGLAWMLWLVTVVAATDTAGYIAGRIIGGPKFWPKISPKKTWSGTIAGWIAAAAVGYCFYLYLGWITIFPVISVFVAFASQLGDIAESAIKRKTGIKDSSNLIPGHGGFMDRFDGMLGASMLLITIITLSGVHSDSSLIFLF